MSTVTLPSAASVSPKKSQGSKTSTTAERARLSRTRETQLKGLAWTGGEILGSMAAATAIAGYKADDLGLFNDRVDARLVAGAGALVYGLWNEKKTNVHAVNVGLGILGSWLYDKAHAFGVNQAAKSEDKAADKAAEKAAEKAAAVTPPVVPAATEPTPGIVLGYVGGADERKARRLERINRRLGKLKEKQGEIDEVSVPRWAVKPAYWAKHGQL
ncbi:MAG: hypothetical protein NTW26_00340 [bacterium]|nr:hypothetical protein [bacterium]